MALILPRAQRKAASPSHGRAPKQEKELANRLGAKVVKGSGCGSEKGDVRKKGFFRVECKTTKHKSFALTRALVEKIEAEALSSNGEIPAMEIEFNDNGKPAMRVAVVPYWVLESLGGIRE